jgi:hypothetical protein
MQKAEAFLIRIKPILATRECIFAQNEKNKNFDRQFNLRHDEKISILKSLTASDCVKIGPNNNPRYCESEVYVFIKKITLAPYGNEEQELELYIKAYINSEKWNEMVVVISFHEEGMYP